MIEYECPKCGEPMESPDSRAGDLETCPNCGFVSPVPAGGRHKAWQIRRARLGSLAATGTIAALQAIGGILLLTMYLLNTLSGIVSGIWLLVLWEWQLILMGLAISLLMPMAFAIVMLPQMGLAAVYLTSEEKGKKALALATGLLASLYGNATIACWVALVFFLFVGLAGGVNTICLLLWSFATAMAPLSYMASKEPPDSTGTALGLLLAQVCYAWLALAWWLGASLGTSLVVLTVLVLLGSAPAGVLTLISMRPREQADYHDWA